MQCLDVIESSSIMAGQLCEDVDLQLMMFRRYGKGFIKTCKVSPDAFIQLALQLAYYRVSVLYLIMQCCASSNIYPYQVLLCTHHVSHSCVVML